MLRKEKQEMIRHIIQAQKLETIVTLTRGLSHDFNNIMQCILSNALMGTIHVKDQKIKSYFEIIQNGSHRACDIINQLQRFGRSSSDDSFCCINPIHIIEEVTSLVRSSFPKIITIKSNYNNSSGSIKGNYTQIHQVLLNIIINAGQALPQKAGIIDIELSEIQLIQQVYETDRMKPYEYVKVSIKDNGMGMDANTLKQIFNPFFTTKKKEEGSGLGLFTAYEIVQAHKGHINAESKVGKGTTFNILFPKTKKTVP